MWNNPDTIDNEIISMAKDLKCNWIGAVKVDAQSAYEYNNCHNNVRIHSSIYGGKEVVGYYFVKGFNVVQAIRHSVWEDNTLVDVTPYKDNREHIIFALSVDQSNDYSIPNCYSQSLSKYLEQESESMYYVYQIVDPRNNQPFYIGKGTGNRASTHLRTVPDTRNVYKENKIASIRKSGVEPVIEYIAENILDEKLAYDIEATVIKKYGRKGYDKNGILTNICPDARPPNHKGKTYEEIYGVNKAKQQRELRSRLQKERGGYGPKQHSIETRKRFSELNSGTGNPMYGKTQKESTKALISEKAKLLVGKKNKNSHTYRLTSPIGDEHILYGGEAADFCKTHNLSWSTLKMQIEKKWGIPKKGKTKGWRLEDLTAPTIFKGFSL